MKNKQFRSRALVKVVTVNRANGDGATNRLKMARKERSKAVVVGPSVMGAGWWIVKKVSGRSAPWMTYTVPATEMARVRR
jgi:hypothetical protein